MSNKHIIYSNVLAKIQFIQDLYSKQFDLSISLHSKEAIDLTIPSNQSMFCFQTCKKQTPFCQDYLTAAKNQDNISLYTKIVTCPLGCTFALSPLGTSIETNQLSEANYYLLIGKIKLEDDAHSLYEQTNQDNPKEKHVLNFKEFEDIVNLITFNMDFLIGLLQLAKIPLNTTLLVDKDYDSLTQREKEVLRLVSIGMSNQEISDNLFISKHTVKVHVSNIFRKFNMSNRTQLALYNIQKM